MLKLAVLCMVTILAFVSCAQSEPVPEIHEGEWKITVNFDMPGMPMQMPPITYNQCITKDNPIPKKDKPNQTCETKSVTVKNNTISWTTECTNRGGAMSGKGTITYKKDTMSGTMTMTMEGQEMKIESQYTGQRLGDCK